MNEPTIILKCVECGRVRLLEAPPARHTDLAWAEPAPAFCPECMEAGLRAMPCTVAPLNAEPAHHAA